MTYFVGKVPDGAVSPGGPTWQALNSTVGTGLKMSPLVRGLVRQIESRPEVLAARAAVVAGGWALKTVKAMRGVKITAAMLKHVFTAAPQGRLETIADYLNQDLEKYHLNTALRLCHFFAQTGVEAGPKALFEEIVDYSPGTVSARNGLMQWKYFREHPEEAESYGRTNAHATNKEAVLNRAYANKNGNGSIASGDGYRYRGRGLKQLTGRENYRKFRDGYQAIYGEPCPDVEANPDLVMTDPKLAVRSAVFFWLKHKLYDKADTGATDAVVKSITVTVNGGETGLPKRKEIFHKCWNNKVFGGI
jgi:predicted chitinase